MKRFILILSLLALCIGLAACSKSQTTPEIDDSFIDGIEQGHEDVFLNLWSATSGITVIEQDKVWETDHFSMLITSGADGDRKSIHIELTSYDLTMEECFDDQQMLINVFSYDEGDFEGILTDDLFYMYASLEELGDHTAHATVGIYDTTERVAVLIAVDGHIYKAVYYIA